MWCFIHLKNLFQWLIPLAKDTQPTRPDPQHVVSQLSSTKSEVCPRHPFCSQLLVLTGVRGWGSFGGGGAGLGCAGRRRPELLAGESKRT